MRKTISINLENIRILAIASAIARSHLTRLVLIAQELQHQNAKVAFAFQENNQILQQDNFQFFPVADAVVTDFSSNVFATYTPSLSNNASTRD